MLLSEERCRIPDSAEGLQSARTPPESLRTMPFDEGHLRNVLLDRLEADLVVRQPHTQRTVAAQILLSSKRQALRFGWSE
jgi:hypothetical protein